MIDHAARARLLEMWRDWENVSEAEFRQGIAAVEAEALERAAQVADAIEREEREYQSKLFGTEGEKLASLAAHTAKKIATAIRAMKEK